MTARDSSFVLDVAGLVRELVYYEYTQYFILVNDIYLKLVHFLNNTYL